MYILASTHESLWWVTLGLGLIVIFAVAALLTTLIVLVGAIEKRVDLIRSTLEQAATNTSDTALIAETATRLDAVLFEGLEHHLFLGRVLDKVRS
jgi:Na+-transporting methylmalonyl-CoA/oxaloacetate decarboxylase gamma subunit|tara:strand:+ start:204 stop:488 length:285 start_codon:yes stop_codon:yes gene_type:complete